MSFIPVTFDPKAVFGKVRAPVKVTLNGYTYRSTIAAMGGPPCIPLRRSNREAADLDSGETLQVRLELDTETREVKPPADFVRALKAGPPAWHRWRELSYSRPADQGSGTRNPRQAGKKALAGRDEKADVNGREDRTSPPDPYRKGLALGGSLTHIAGLRRDRV